VLLQRFAYSLIKNADVQVSRTTAVSRIAHAMQGLRSHDTDPELIVQHMLERTRLLREPHPDAVQVVHRTFRGYLAAQGGGDSRPAREGVAPGALRPLIEHAPVDPGHEVGGMAGAHARPQERESLLRELRAGNAEARRSRLVADRLQLVAAACLEQADVTGTG